MNPKYISQLEEDGYAIIPKMVEHQFLDDVKDSITALFMSQVEYTNSTDIIELYEKHNDRFLNCAKHAQWNLQLHHLGVMLGYKVGNFMKDPLVNICTRPVVFFNNKHTANKTIHHTTPAHQDSKSMQGSSDALVCWVPLIDITEELGRLEVVAKSHKLGDLSSDIEEGFGQVKDTEELEFEAVDVPKGSVLIFDSNLVHRSGTIEVGTRWSAHFRFNNMYDPNFVERGYPHPYIYKPVKL